MTDPHVGLAACGEGSKAPADTSTSLPNSTTSTLVPPDGKRSDERTLTLFDTIANDNLQPKSIVHSGTGLFFAQNMMYRHNISVFDRQSNLIATIDDKVDLASFGINIPNRSSVVRGSPVEAAFSPDAKYAYVSNYAMYGTGWDPSALDTCQGKDHDQSFVYRVDTTTLEIDKWSWLVLYQNILLSLQTISTLLFPTFARSMFRLLMSRPTKK